MGMNVIVGQSGGPTAVINSSLAGVFQTAKDRGAGKVYGMLNGIQGLLERRYVDLSEYLRSQADIDLLKRTPSSYLGSCRFKLPPIEAGKEVYEQIFTILRELEIGAFFYIGGNDSMDTIKMLADYAELVKSDIRFVGVPKTIDNDLACTDHTPGYGSAAKYIASVIREAALDSLVYDMDSVTIIEIMGRNAGWLTAAAALARDTDSPGADLIYLPEVPFDMEAFTAKVRALVAEKRSIVVAVSEGVKLADGRYVCELSAADGAVDAFGHKMLQGTARFLADRLNGETGIKTRAIELNTLQRCAAHIASATDVNEAFMAGGQAVKTAFEGQSGMVATLQRISDAPYICVTDCQDVHLIANVEKKVPQEWITEDGTYVSEELIGYIRPLIQGELAPVMIGGLPAHLHIDRSRK